ncbi:hypothetical protein KUCAC02_016729, partial [Chaenocephalus aceratus]
MRWYSSVLLAPHGGPSLNPEQRRSAQPTASRLDLRCSPDTRGKPTITLWESCIECADRGDVGFSLVWTRTRMNISRKQQTDCDE